MAILPSSVTGSWNNIFKFFRELGKSPRCSRCQHCSVCSCVYAWPSQLGNRSERFLWQDAGTWVPATLPSSLQADMRGETWNSHLPGIGGTHSGIRWGGSRVYLSFPSNLPFCATSGNVIYCARAHTHTRESLSHTSSGSLWPQTALGTRMAFFCVSSHRFPSVCICFCRNVPFW